MFKKFGLSIGQKSIAYAGFGMLIEWYDFVLYSYLSVYLIAVFLSDYSKTTAQMLLMLIFAFAYVGKVVGGSILASFADRYGRKRIFILSALLMCASAALMASFPVHRVHGLEAVIALLCLRVIQGVSIGSETPGGIVFAFEHASKKYRSLSIAAILVSISFGYLLASSVCTLLTSHLNHHEMINYGWRIPYVVAAVLGIVLFFLRRGLAETPGFLKAKISVNSEPFRNALKSKWLVLVLAIGCYVVAACYSVFSDMSMPYLTHYFHYKPHQLYRVDNIECIMNMAYTFVVALLIDWLGVKRTLYFSFLVLVAVLLPSFWLLKRQTGLAYLIWEFSGDMADITAWVSLLYYLSANIAVNMRVTVVTLFENITTLIGAMFPAVITYLLQTTGDRFIVAKVGWLLSIIPLISIVFFKRYISKSVLSN